MAGLGKLYLLRRWFNMVRHVSQGQLLARLYLKIKRLWMVRFANYYRKELYSSAIPDISAPAMQVLPIYQPRKHLLSKVQKDSLGLRFLNTERIFNFPIEWHLPELNQGTRLWKLNLHYMEFTEGLDDSMFEKTVESWISGNPPFMVGYWLDSWNSYALSIRCVVWMQQISRRQSKLTSEFIISSRESLFRQLRFLRSNLELDIGGNHLIKNIKALLLAGCFFKSDESDEWYAKGLSLLDTALREQILKDGMHFERSPAYHSQVLADLIECRVALGDEAFDHLDSTLVEMSQALADLTHPDGYISLFNDGGIGMTYSPSEIVGAFEQITGLIVSNRKCFYMAEAGYAGFRNSDDYFLYDCGPIAPDSLPAHGHGDVFSFEWTVASKRLVIDTGVFEYNAGPRRDYSRCTRAHNTVTLDDMDQAEFWGAFRVGQRPRVTNVNFNEITDGIVISGSHDGYSKAEGQPIHNRKVIYTSGKLEVIDSICGGAGQQVVARILIHSDWEIEIHEAGAFISYDGIRVDLSTKGKITLIKAPWYSDFGVEGWANQLVIDYGNSPVKDAGFILRR